MATYDFKSFPRRCLSIHALRRITDIRKRWDITSFKVFSWTNKHHVLINGIRSRPEVEINGNKIRLDAPHEFDADDGRLVLQLTTPTSLIRLRSIH